MFLFIAMFCSFLSSFTVVSSYITDFMLAIYTVSQKKLATCCLIITLANVDRFLKFFHQLIHKKILYLYITKTWWKNSENWSTFAKVINEHFWGTNFHGDATINKQSTRKTWKFGKNLFHCCWAVASKEKKQKKQNAY